MANTKPAVCIIVENLPVPLDRRVWKEACALRDAGYRVSVICPKGKVKYSATYEKLEEVEIYRHRNWEAASIPGYLVEYTVALVAELYLTLVVFGRTRFKILQACNPPDTIFLIAWLLKPLGVRFVFDHHDLGPELYETKFVNKRGLFYRLTRLVEFCSFKTARVCIATNESFKEIAIRRGGKRPDEVFVVRNCPDLKSLRGYNSTAPSKFGKSFLVVYVGFMGAQDGLPLLIESIKHLVLNGNRRDTHFVLIGDGPELPRLQKQVSQYGLGDFVTFTGQVAYEEVGAYLSSADIGVAPDPKTTMNDQSTMIKIIEYMACGLPVVLFDLKEGRRIATDAALYAESNDPSDFAGKIIALLDSPDLRRRLGEFGRNEVEQRLNWGVEKNSLLQAYECALK